MTTEAQRRAKREYMRRFRALPENVRRERERDLNRRIGKIIHEARLVQDPRRPTCAYCGKRPRTKIERLIVARNGAFIPQVLPYCGSC